MGVLRAFLPAQSRQSTQIRNSCQRVEFISESEDRSSAMRSVILWLLGVPIGVIILLNIFNLI
jgi:hypothetical protein